MKSKDIVLVLLVLTVFGIIRIFWSQFPTAVTEEFQSSMQSNAKHATNVNEDAKKLIKSSIQKQNNIKFKRCTPLSLPHVDQNVVNNFTRTEADDWNIWYPCGYTNVETELENNNNFADRTSGWVMGITGADNFAAKDRLWDIMQKQYGRMRAQIYMPESWLTYDPKQMQLFFKHAKNNPGEMYIMKKNLQRQEGLHIFTDAEEARDAFRKDYVVIQKVLKNPYLVNGKKINIRVYVLIQCKNGVKTLYVYDDGFVYYSSVPYDGGTTREQVITTGYQPREVYETHPLTTKDLLSYIARKHGSKKATDFISMRDFVLKGFMSAFATSFCSVTNNVSFSQTYGVDMQPNHDLTDMKILEFNKGQSVEIMDKKDGELKQKMTDDIYRTIGVIPNTPSNGFIKIWSSS